MASTGLFDAGTSNDEIQAAKGIRPLFDDPEEGHA